MGRFLNKQELIIIVLLILLLDFNGFISTALNHIMYGQRRNTWIFLFSVALLLYDIFIMNSDGSYLIILLDFKSPLISSSLINLSGVIAHSFCIISSFPRIFP